MKRNDDFKDDGRTVADMSDIDRPSLFSLKRNNKKPDYEQNSAAPQQEMPREQRRAYIIAAVFTALGVAAIFMAAIALAIWLMLIAWR